jgi:hypothetical protein
MLIALFSVGCNLQARLYNLGTGEVTPATFTYGGSGRGKIDGVSPSGEKYHGEYITSARQPANWGSIYAAVYGTEGAAYGNSGSKSNQYGTAIVTGNKKTVLDCEYVTNSLVHGSGACTDNNGGRYKLIF